MANAAQFLVAKNVFDFVAQNPGKKQEDIVAALADSVKEMGRSPATARTMLYALKRAGAVVRQKEKGVRAGAFVVADNLQGIEVTPAMLSKYVTRAPQKIETEAINPVPVVETEAAPAVLTAPALDYDPTKFSPPKGEGEMVRIPKGQPNAGRFLPRFVRG
jgi:hypothetical protein